MAIPSYNSDFSPKLEDIDFNDLENFNFIEMWVNTACPRIGYDDMLAQEKPIVDLSDI